MMDVFQILRWRGSQLRLSPKVGQFCFVIVIDVNFRDTGGGGENMAHITQLLFLTN